MASQFLKSIIIANKSSHVHVFVMLIGQKDLRFFLLLAPSGESEPKIAKGRMRGKFCVLNRVNISGLFARQFTFFCNLRRQVVSMFSVLRFVQGVTNVPSWEGIGVPYLMGGDGSPIFDGRSPIMAQDGTLPRTTDWLKCIVD